jgi:ribosomal protein S18 acetylase RimI-like enzyme
MVIGIGQVRRAEIEDAEAVLDLALLADLAEVGEPNTTLDLVMGDLDSPVMRTAAIDDPRGGLRGYAYIEYQDGHERCWGDIIVKPGADVGVGRLLVEWVRGQAQELAPGKPVHLFCDSSNHLKQKVYAEAGGIVVRRFYRMGVTFTDDQVIDVPPPSTGVGLRHVTEDESDLRTMHTVIDTAFADHFGHEAATYEDWRRHSVDGSCGDLSLWWLATVDGEPAAGLYGSVLPTAGYVDTLGTLRAYRGKGLGRLLLLTAFAEFHRRGFRKVVLGVDATNPTGAVALYESVGMHPETVGLRHELPPLMP